MNTNEDSPLNDLDTTQHDLIIKNNTEARNQHLTMLESINKDDGGKEVMSALGILRDWIEKAGEVAELVLPIIGYEHTIRVVEGMKKAGMALDIADELVGDK